MSAQSLPSHAVSEYLAAERSSKHKHEYYNGTIVALVGGSEAHNLITSNLITALNVHLFDRPCKVYPSDMRLRIPQSTTYVYPDVSVVCGKVLFDDSHCDTLLNPVILIEVLSPATERNDRGRKFHGYQLIDSLREYLLVAQDEYRVDQYIRQDNGTWLFRSHISAQSTCTFESIGCAVSLATIYHKVDIEREHQGEEM